MATISKLAILLSLNRGGFDSGLKGAGKSLDGFASRLPSVTGMLARFGAAFGAFEAFKAFAEAEQNAAKLEAVLNATGYAAGFTSEQIAKYAGELQQLTTFEDDATIGAAAMLATFTRIRGDNFKQALLSAQNLATVMQTDLKSAVVLVGKVLNDPASGLAKLNKAGIQFTESQKALIKSLQESGNIMGAQQVILAALEAKFGGAAEAVGNTFSGKVTQAKNSLGNLAEVVAGVVAPAIGKFADMLKVAAEWAQKNSDAIRSIVKWALASAVAVYAFRTALWAVVAAKKAVAAAQAIILALQGPKGWLQLAAATAIAAGSIWAVNKAFDEITANAPASTVAQVTNEINKLGDSAEDAAENGVAKLAEKIKGLEKTLSSEILTFGRTAREAERIKLIYEGAESAQLNKLRAMDAELTKLEQEKKTREEIAEKAKQLKDDILTKEEKHQKKIEEINALAEKGAITEEERLKAINNATDDLLANKEKKKRPEFKSVGDTKIAAFERRFTAGFRETPKDDKHKAKMEKLTERGVKAGEKTAKAVEELGKWEAVTFGG